MTPLEKPTEWVKLDCPFRQPDDSAVVFWATTFNWHRAVKGEKETLCRMPTEPMYKEGSWIKPGLDIGKKMQQMCEICRRGKAVDEEAD